MRTRWNTAIGENPGSLTLPISDNTWLRLLDEDDAPELHSLIEENRALLRPWLPWAASQTFEDTVDFIRRTRAQAAAKDGLQTALVRDGAIAGMVGYVAVDWQHRSTNIGYWLAEGHQGGGMMTGAVTVLVEHAFDVWDLNRVEIRAASENSRSRAIPERLGFRQEGVLRRAELVDGRYLDSVVYAILAADWGGPPSGGR